MKRPVIKEVDLTRKNVIKEFAILPAADLTALIDYAKWAEEKLDNHEYYNTLMTNRIKEKITQLERDVVNARHLGVVTDCKRAIIELKELL